MPRKAARKPSKPVPPAKTTRRSEAAAQPLTEQLKYFEERREKMVETIRHLVEVESPSDDKAACDKLSSLLAGRFEALGCHAKFHRVPNFGNHLQVDFGAERRAKPVLLLGHYDTVYPLGTLKNMPCRVEGGRLFGPGVLDMKSGIVHKLQPSEALRARHQDELRRPESGELVADEEVGH